MDLFTVISIPAVICFIIGIGLLLFEMYIPGFGIAGVSGIILLVVSIVLQAHSLLEGLILFLAIGILITILALIFYHSATRGAIAKSDIILKSESSSNINLPFFIKEGTKGKTITPLRPAGSALFGEIKADVLTDGEYIAAGKTVTVSQIQGNRIFVTEDKD